MGIVDEGYGFSKSTWFDREFTTLRGRVQTPSFKPIVESYVDSMGRVLSMHNLLSQVGFMAAAQSRAASSAPFDTGVAQEDVYRTEDAGVIAEFESRTNALLVHLKNLGPDMARQWVVDTGSTIIEHMSASEKQAILELGAPDIIGRGMAAMFYSMVLSSYAAFETLAADLWVASVNLKPKLYKQIKGKAAEKMIPLDQLEKIQYDVKNRMGDLLKDSGKVSFLSLENTIEAYEYTFGNGADGCRVFKQNPDIEKTEQVRHLIAHKGGRVDLQFQRLSETYKWKEFAAAKQGEHLPIDGELACFLVNACVKTAVDLTLFVEGKQPPRSES